MTGLNRLIYVDLKTSLPDDLLVLTDKMTMAASIECRAPFIDQELVELASVMPEFAQGARFDDEIPVKEGREPLVAQGNRKPEKKRIRRTDGRVVSK